MSRCWWKAGRRSSLGPLSRAGDDDSHHVRYATIAKQRSAPTIGARGGNCAHHSNDSDGPGRGFAIGRPAISQGAGFPDPSGAHRGGVSARRPDRFRRAHRGRKDEPNSRPARLYRQQARRQRHAGRRRRRQIRSRRLLAVPHHRRRGDGVAAHHAENAVRHVPRFRAGRAGHTVHEVLVVSPKLGVKNVKELVALAKKKPGAITFASTGVGSPPHLAQIAARCGSRREIPPRALSRRGAGADRSCSAARCRLWRSTFRS